MKRILVYILAAAAALAIPMESIDVGKLQPVGLVQVYKEKGNIIIKTDTEDSGKGDQVSAAFEDLERTTAGVVFLDTADYLLLSADAADSLPDLSVYLKPGVRVCLADGGIDPAQAAEFLNVHRPPMKLRDCEGIQNLPKLEQENGRLKLK